MDSPQKLERIEGIRRTLETRETEDLLEIWQTNDRLEWTPEAFEAIQRILEERNVSLPVQNAAVEESNIETPGRNEEVEEPDTYYDRHRLDRISGVARSLSWLAIALLALTLIYGVIYILQMLSTLGSLGTILLAVLILLGVPVLIFGLIWVLLQVIAEGIYLFMDVEENTRKGASS